MKVLLTSMIAVSCIAAVGCERVTPHPDQFGQINVSMVRVLNQSAVDEAIVVQHTLYPYHFVPHSAALNILGRRDLEVLMEHYRAFGGPSQPLNVRQGATPDALYEQRVAAVVDAVTKAGLDVEQIDINDGVAGGTGMPSERMIMILASDREITASGRRISRDRQDGGTTR